MKNWLTSIRQFLVRNLRWGLFIATIFAGLVFLIAWSGDSGFVESIKLASVCWLISFPIAAIPWVRKIVVITCEMAITFASGR